ncbi:transcriptional regulator [Mycobacterium tuberculosis]|nr:transcriptional regulator [Mycobacterium tuberculosis]
MVINSSDPDVELIRGKIARRTHYLISTAAGDDADAETVGLLEVFYAGAMVLVGTGLISRADIAEQLEMAVRRIL